MATLDVLTVYQSWKGFQLFDEVMVQMHRYQFLKSWQWMSTVVRELQFSVIVFQTRPPSKAEDMGLSQGSSVSFLKERVKEVFTSIHVSVESTKPAEVYTTDTAES